MNITFTRSPFGCMECDSPRHVCCPRKSSWDVPVQSLAMYASFFDGTLFGVKETTGKLTIFWGLPLQKTSHASKRPRRCGRRRRASRVPSASRGPRACATSPSRRWTGGRSGRARGGRRFRPNDPKIGREGLGVDGHVLGRPL